jgi:beta-N-acetylglucosaminidase
MRAWSLFVLSTCVACSAHEAPPAPPTSVATETTRSLGALSIFTPRYQTPITVWHEVGSVCVTADAPQLAASRVAVLAARAQLPVVGVDGCAWRYTFLSTPPQLTDDERAAWSEAGDTAERFIVKTALEGAELVTSIYAPSARGAAYAVDAAFVLLSVESPSGALAEPTATLIDWPAMSRRGSAEGFYGPPFADFDRQSVLFWMREARENTYVYAPQNDDYAHIVWYEPYPAEQLTAFSHAASVAAAGGIDFIWVVRPGQGQFYPSAQPIRYASDEDFATLTAKLDQVRATGVRRFGLFFDDNYPALLDPTDIATFPSLVAAQAYLINRVDDYLVALDADTKLLVIGTSYSKLYDDWQSYSEAFGPALHANIEVLWAGNQTYNPTITADDVAPAVVALGRTPIIWDNWPRFVTPLSGRSPDLPTQAMGLISNAVVCSWQGMPAASFTEILGTAAAYAWNPDDYDGYLTIADWSGEQTALANASCAVARGGRGCK